VVKMDIIISKNEIIEYEKMKINTELTVTKEKVKLYETKYGCSLNEFKAKMEAHEEVFEEWDDYIEWRAHIEVLKDLEEKLKKIEHAKKIKII
jgi:hypothetical protein